MSRSRVWIVCLLVAMTAPGLASGQIPGPWPGGLTSYLAPPMFVMPNPFAPFPFRPPRGRFAYRPQAFFMTGPAVVLPQQIAAPILGVDAGPLGAIPPGFVPRPDARRPVPPRPARPDRAKSLVSMGDNNFRAGNLHRAQLRYDQAVEADPGSAAPRLGLAQVAIVRGDYADAANFLREAEAAEPGWLIGARDVEAMYAEPVDFRKQVSRLEAHLQAHPRDRDAWLVLGAQWYLSGRARKASDIFLRLTDREPDPTLAAFLAAAAPPPGNPPADPGR